MMDLHWLQHCWASDDQQECCEPIASAKKPTIAGADLSFDTSSFVLYNIMKLQFEKSNTAIRYKYSLVSC